MPKLDSGTSIFTVMSRMAVAHNAINLSQGFPNFPIDSRLTDIVSRIVRNNVHQYMPSAGHLPLLEKITQLVAGHYHRTIAPIEEVLVTAGATQAIFASVQALVHAGEEVLILDPAYDCYDAPVILCGARPIHLSLRDDFSPDWDVIGRAVNRKTRMIIINNPHNPSGKTWCEQDFAALEDLLDKHPQLLVLSDEVYEFIAFEKPHISVNQRERLRNRSVIVSSFGKSFHITGWKIGYVIAPADLMRDIKSVHQYLVFCVNSVAQTALAEYLDVVNLSDLRAFYQAKRDRFRDLMKDTRFTLLPCEGSYFQVASYSAISEESDLDFTQKLVTVHGVAAIPLSVFHQSKKDDKLIRFCFAKDDETLANAAERLQF